MICTLRCKISRRDDGLQATAERAGADVSGHTPKMCVSVPNHRPVSIKSDFGVIQLRAKWLTELQRRRCPAALKDPSGPSKTAYAGRSWTSLGGVCEVQAHTATHASWASPHIQSRCVPDAGAQGAFRVTIRGDFETREYFLRSFSSLRVPCDRPIHCQFTKTAYLSQ